MPNRLLTANELQDLFAPFLTEVREKLKTLSNGDAPLLWALRRKLAKELSYDERGKPMQRRALKTAKRAEQNGLCAVCQHPLPEEDAVLDRLEAMAGYTSANTRLLCRPCDYNVQRERRFA